MHKRDALIVDYGPAFSGSAVRTGEGIVCVVPRQIRDRPEVEASMRQMGRNLGGTCGHCPHCPIGQEG